MAMVLIPVMILCLAMFDSVFAVRLPAQCDAGSPANSQVENPATPAANLPLTIIDGRIGRQPIYNVLVGCGIAPSEVLSLTRSFEGIFDFRNARPKDEYQICLTPQKKLQKLTYKTGLTNHFVAVRTDNGDFYTYRREISLEKETVARSFTIESSLYQAVTGQGESGHLVAAFADIFSWDIDFYLYPRKGDSIRVLFEKYSLNGQFIKYGKIIAAQYIGSSKKFSAFYFDDGRQTGYYDENGVPLRKMFLRVPVKFGMRTSSYSIRRFHPISKKYKRHTGIDYSAAHGTSIFATAGGTVAFAGWRSGYGKLVVIRHPNGYKTYYGHCSRLLVKKGNYVKQGQTIARVGRTGQATGPHVHYEVRINGKPVNPNNIKSTKGNPLPSDQRARFDNLVQTRLLTMEDYLYSEI
ncbi:Putative tail protein (ACLAME 1) [Olavius sp. associated proteobacterium Delta 1]|nr:Putative tail protein (ACLAME 1) [Olavius sp. associated proteobacterium Delta 1]